MFFRLYKHLLPRAKAWNLTANKSLRDFFKGLVTLGSDVEKYYDDILDDVDPQKTRQLTSWDEQFGLQTFNGTEQAQRDRLSGAWKALGGQDPTYIQNTLQQAGFDVYVHEWWVPGSESAVNVKAPATARNPNTYLGTGLGYTLVNKILQSGLIKAQDGTKIMQDGNPKAMDGEAGGYSFKQYLVTSDPNTFPYYLYIGASTFPVHASMPDIRRNELETLCLKICPTQNWIGMLVDYV